MTFFLSILAFVPTVCWVDPGYEVFCNAPNGYELVAVDETGTERLVDSSLEPTHKTVTLELKNGENLIFKIK